MVPMPERTSRCVSNRTCMRPEVMRPSSALAQDQAPLPTAGSLPTIGVLRPSTVPSASAEPSYPALVDKPVQNSNLQMLQQELERGRQEVQQLVKQQEKARDAKDNEQLQKQVEILQKQIEVMEKMIKLLAEQIGQQPQGGKIATLEAR